MGNCWEVRNIKLKKDKEFSIMKWKQETFKHIFKENQSLFESKAYARADLIQLSEENKNSVNTFESEKEKQFLSENGIKFYNKNTRFFPYSCESTDDNGWGCAWRCIQSVIITQLHVQSLAAIDPAEKILIQNAITHLNF